MKCLSMKVSAFLLCCLLIIGCGGGSDSNFNIYNDSEGTIDGNIIDGVSFREASSIDFISATPQAIALKGTGGPPRSEASVLIFKVVDIYGNLLPNQAVDFKLSTEVGGLSLSNPSAWSNADGLARVTVISGKMPTHVRVHATLAGNPSITVVSDELVVSTGLPDQDSITLCVPEACSLDVCVGGECLCSGVYFYAADHFNNWVPDGTVIYFTTEGGSIDDSCEIKDGECTVCWKNTNPKPSDARCTILAFCIGEESFHDINGNGFFDPNDSFDPNTDLGEPFRDDNENGVYDYGEEFWDSNENEKYDEGNGIYNGVLCSDAAEALKLCTKELVYVQAVESFPWSSEPSWSGVDASSIDFISATPQVIALKGTGGPSRSEASVLTFKVVDIYGNPLPNQAVDFKLSTEVGGLSLSNPVAWSNTDGLARVTVISGKMPTHVRVHATLVGNPSITVVSDELLVSTGLPDQDSISISAEILNPEALNYNNVEVEIIFQAADHFNNFVPDGTVVYFTTEGGSIDDYCELKDGVCTVMWRSGNPRPKDGRFTILAFSIGEESFSDVNGNGIFDENDFFDSNTEDLAEPFRDDNENRTYDYILVSEAEKFWDCNGNGEYDEGNGIYNGILCSDTAQDLELCSRELIYVQTSIYLVMSGSWATITFSPEEVDLRGGGSQTVLISIADVNNNTMPEGTEVEVEATNGELVGDTSFAVPNTNRHGPLVYSVTLEPSKNDRESGVLQVKVTTPFNNVSTESIPVRDDN